MNLKLNNEVVGKIYCNLQINKKSLGEPYPDFLAKWKAGKVKLTFGKVQIILDAYRRTYSDDQNIYFEGAELIFE